MLSPDTIFYVSYFTAVPKKNCFDRQSWFHCLLLFWVVLLHEEPRVNVFLHTFFSFSTSTSHHTPPPPRPHFLFHLFPLLLLLPLRLRSWTGLVKMTRTSSPLFTLVFAKPSRPMGHRTPHCSPEHSRTKLSMCTGLRKNAKRAAKGPDRPSETGENTMARMEGAK